MAKRAGTRKSKKSSRKGTRKQTEWQRLVKAKLASGLKFGDALKAAKKEYRK